MSLTITDLQEIRAIVSGEVKPLAGQVEALNNDVKEIYFMLARRAKKQAISRTPQQPSYFDRVWYNVITT